MRLAVAVFAVLLAACGDKPGPVDDPAPTETPISVDPDDRIGAVAESPPDAPGMIPARFHGIWDYIEGSCARESDMRMEISGDEILFYESIGIVTDAVAEGEDMVLTLAMEGEGETWVERLRLSLNGNGDDARLSTSDGDAPKTTDQYPSKRCPT